MAIKNLILYGTYDNFPKEGVKFIDLTPSLLDSSLSKEIVKQLMNLYEEEKGTIDYIISPDARGFIWGGMLAAIYDIGFIPVRKPNKLPANAISGMVKYETEYSTTELNLPNVDLNNKKVLFVDDVYATGGTYKAVEELVEKANGYLIGGAVVVDVELDDNPKVKCLVRGSELI
jgi:Adenine/guanine phosphoribosyltransferases and related PRPP-binding proteins